ncbi:hypothetical protein COO60DRAFT_127921 [Scenedesmus sp. NREL 46B-D3]|nr:hypothetical protein COO60DRAFT_127921 [Scenedesmus sp. NREL 46B-D3]
MEQQWSGAWLQAVVVSYPHADVIEKLLGGCLQDTHKQQPSQPSSPAYTAAAINYGILLFVQQQHAKALAVLEPLHSDVEAMHDGAALCLCVLLLEIYLASGQLPKAAQVLHYLQSSNSPGVAARAAFSEDAHPSPWQSPRTTQGSEQQQQLQLQAQQQQHAEQQPELPVSLDLPIVTRCTSAFMQQVSQLVAQQGGQLCGMHVPALLHLYKARLAMACCNHKAAKKELRALLVLQPSSPAAVLLKSQLDVLRQQPKKALKALGPLLAAISECTPRCRLQLLNVLAAIHHQLGKHHVAAMYLTTALAQQQAASCKQQGPLNSSSSSQNVPNQQQQVGTDKRQQGSGKQRQGTGKQQGSKGNAAKAKAHPSAPDNSNNSSSSQPSSNRSSTQHSSSSSIVLC